MLWVGHAAADPASSERVHHHVLDPIWMDETKTRR